MGWTRLKLILAAALILANGILFLNVWKLYRSSGYISEDAMDLSEKILSENGVDISSAAIDLKKPKLLIYDGTLAEEYHEKVAEKLSQSMPSRSFNTPTGFIMIMENGDRFTFSSGFTVRYQKAETESSENLSELNWNALEELSGTEEKKTLRAVEAFLKPAYFLDSDGKRSGLSAKLLAAGKKPGSDTVYCTVVQYVKDTDVYNLTASFTVAGDSVTEMNGEWCFAQLDASYSAQLLDQINILYSVKNRVAADNSGSEPEIRRMTSLSICYTSYFRADSDRFYLIPAWNTKFEDGEEYIINAVDGTLYTKQQE